MGFLPIVLAAGSALFSGASAIGQANYKAQVARRNAVIAGQNANLAAQQAQANSMRQDREMAATQGQQLAIQAGSGLDALGASQVAARATTTSARDQGALDIRRQGEAQTASYFNQQTGFLGDASAAGTEKTGAFIGTALKLGSIAADNGLFGKSLLGQTKSKRAKFG